MSKSDQYRAHAQECQRMARISHNVGEKSTWLQLSEHWLNMIPKAELTKSEQFDAAELAQGTRQTKSEESR
jgi:hypothetical protein